MIVNCYWSTFQRKLRELILHAKNRNSSSPNNSTHTVFSEQTQHIYIDYRLRPLHVWNILKLRKIIACANQFPQCFLDCHLIPRYFVFTLGYFAKGGALLQHLVLILWAAEGIFHSHFLLATAIFTYSNDEQPLAMFVHTGRSFYNEKKWI